MGQVRQRGPDLARVAASQLRALPPQQQPQPAMGCNACGQTFKAPRPVNTRALRGIECAFQADCAICAICATCDQDTWAVRGDPAAVRVFYGALEKAMGQKVQLGTAKPGFADDGNALQPD